MSDVRADATPWWTDEDRLRAIRDTATSLSVHVHAIVCLMDAGYDDGPLAQAEQAAAREDARMLLNLLGEDRE